MAAVEYGRGAEIFPETSDKIIRLEDSFPNGTIPPEVAIALSNGLSTGTLGDESTGDGTYLPSSVSSGSSSTSSTKKGRKRKMVRGAISRILKLAAKSEEQALLESSSSSSSSSANDNYDPFGTAQLLTDRTINKSPSSAIALVLLASGLVPPTQLLCVIFLSGYMTLLVFIASSSKIEGSSGSGSNDNDSAGTRRKSMPSLPPQGHVPSLISNPLGRVLTDSRTYRIWLRIGTVVGLIGPLAAVGWYRFAVGDVGLATLVAKSVFLLCCQASTDAVARRMLAPLPLRILIPVAYNAFRLPPLYEWAMVPTSLSVGCPMGMSTGVGIGRILAIANILYWGMHLFGFLLPIATMRYLRSYFFCVEAAEVTMREGGESNIGLL